MCIAAQAANTPYCCCKPSCSVSSPMAVYTLGTSQRRPRPKGHAARARATCACLHAVQLEKPRGSNSHTGASRTIRRQEHFKGAHLSAKSLVERSSSSASARAAAFLLAGSSPRAILQCNAGLAVRAHAPVRVHTTVSQGSKPQGPAVFRLSSPRCGRQPNRETTLACERYLATPHLSCSGHSAASTSPRRTSSDAASPGSQLTFGKEHLCKAWPPHGSAAQMEQRATVNTTKRRTSANVDETRS